MNISNLGRDYDKASFSPLNIITTKTTLFICLRAAILRFVTRFLYKRALQLLSFCCLPLEVASSKFIRDSSLQFSFITLEKPEGLCGASNGKIFYSNQVEYISATFNCAGDIKGACYEIFEHISQLI